MLRQTVMPTLSLGHDTLLMVVVLFGRTINPICSSGRPRKKWTTSRAPRPRCTPLAGNFAYLLFSLGIIGAGMLAVPVPVLAGSGACAVAEAASWPGTLSARLDRGEGRGFYAVIGVATLGGQPLPPAGPGDLAGFSGR